jgi:DNA-binding transcriptional regulator YiaG
MSDYGYCECGCGERTIVSLVTDRHHGWTKGEPRRFLAGHNNRLRRAGHDVVDMGFATPCWLWRGWVNDRGYGRASSHPAHVIYYKRHVGPIPEGLQLDHLCRVRLCVNPAHLEPVTHAENIRRGAEARSVSCGDQLADAIRDARHTARLSQGDLAQRIGVTQSAVGMWERARVKPTTRNMAALSRVLRRDLAEYAGRTDPVPDDMETFGGAKVR